MKLSVPILLSAFAFVAQSNPIVSLKGIQSTAKPYVEITEYVTQVVPFTNYYNTYDYDYSPDYPNYSHYGRGRRSAEDRVLEREVIGSHEEASKHEGQRSSGRKSTLSEIISGINRDIYGQEGQQPSVDRIQAPVRTVEVIPELGEQPSLDRSPSIQIPRTTVEVIPELGEQPSSDRSPSIQIPSRTVEVIPELGEQPSLNRNPSIQIPSKTVEVIPELGEQPSLDRNPSIQIPSRTVEVISELGEQSSLDKSPSIQIPVRTLEVIPEEREQPPRRKSQLSDIISGINRDIYGQEGQQSSINNNPSSHQPSKDVSQFSQQPSGDFSQSNQQPSRDFSQLNQQSSRDFSQSSQQPSREFSQSNQQPSIDDSPLSQQSLIAISHSSPVSIRNEQTVFEHNNHQQPTGTAAHVSDIVQRFNEQLFGEFGPQQFVNEHHFNDIAKAFGQPLHENFPFESSAQDQFRDIFRSIEKGHFSKGGNNEKKIILLHKSPIFRQEKQRINDTKRIFRFIKN